MSKKIILFKGGVETLGFFSQELEKAFRAMGHETFMYDYDREAESAYALLRFLGDGGRDAAVVSFNFHGLCNEDILRDDRNVYIWEEMDIPCYNIVVDHPFYYDRFMHQLPRRYCQISIDGNHRDYMERFYPEVKTGPFLPLAGTDAGPLLSRAGADSEREGDRVLSIAERPVDVIFTGSWAEPEFWGQYMAEEGPEYEEFYRSILKEQIANPGKTFEEIFEPRIRAEAEDAGEITDELLRETYPHLIHFDMYVRYLFRGEVVRLLAESGIKVVCIGGGWDKLPCGCPENIIHYGYTNSLECLKEIRRAKISLNVMPWFKRGAHDRIFNTMLNGAVCVTDSSEYLDGILKSGENCEMYSLDDLCGAVRAVNSLLADPGRMQEIADNGRRLALEGHTWAHRAQELHELIEDEYC